MNCFCASGRHNWTPGGGGLRNGSRSLPSGTDLRTVAHGGHVLLRRTGETREVRSGTTGATAVPGYANWEFKISTVVCCGFSHTNVRVVRCSLLVCSSILECIALNLTLFHYSWPSLFLSSFAIFFLSLSALLHPSNFISLNDPSCHPSCHTFCY